MIRVLAGLVFACPPTTIVNTTPYPWNAHDQKTLNYAKRRCGQIYHDAKCAKLFKKWGAQDYTVICGKAR